MVLTFLLFFQIQLSPKVNPEQPPYLTGLIHICRTQTGHPGSGHKKGQAPAGSNCAHPAPGLPAGNPAATAPESAPAKFPPPRAKGGPHAPRARSPAAMGPALWLQPRHSTSTGTARITTAHRLFNNQTTTSGVWRVSLSLICPSSTDATTGYFLTCTVNITSC